MDKKEKNLIKETVKSSADAMKKIIAATGVKRAVNEIKKEVEETLDDTKKKVTQIVDHLSAKMLSFFLLVIGLLLGFLGASVFIAERSTISLGTSLMIVGLLVAILGWVAVKK